MPKVSFFLTCTVDLLYPSAARACVGVLEALGVEVEFPEDQTCCGQPWLNTGHADEAKHLALRFLSTFEGAEGVVGPSSSCIDTVRNVYPTLFAESDPLRARVEALGARCYEFCEYLHRVLAVRDLPRHPAPRRTTYHSSCRTLRGIELRGVAEHYLAQTLGEAFVPLAEADSCCGFGGSFSVKLPEISGKLMADKLRHVVATGADDVAALDLSCLTHLSAGARRQGLDRLRFVHLAQILAPALGVAP